MLAQLTTTSTHPIHGHAPRPTAGLCLSPGDTALFNSWLEHNADLPRLAAAHALSLPAIRAWAAQPHIAPLLAAAASLNQLRDLIRLGRSLHARPSTPPHSARVTL